MIPDAQPSLVFQHDSDHIQTTQVAGLDVAVYSRRSPTKETPNEDAAGIIPVDERAAVFAVADGLGGQRGGVQASNMAIQQFADTIIRECTDPALLRVSILDGIERANSQIQTLGIGAATTLAAIEFRSGEIRPYHVGDSTILMTGQRGRIKWQTVSHSPVGFAVESGLLDEDEALHHEDRHLVSNVVGAAGMRIELGPSLPMARNDTVLLASDGLFDNLRPEEVINVMRKGPVAQAAANLAALARQRMLNPVDGFPSKADDLTLILLRQVRSTPSRRVRRTVSGTIAERPDSSPSGIELPQQLAAVH